MVQQGDPSLAGDDFAAGEEEDVARGATAKLET